MIQFSKTISMNKKRIAYKVMLMCWMMAAFTSTLAQNINTPNKMGPMGTEINTLTGNLFLSRNDFYIPGRGFPIDISFHYNSVNYRETGNFGKGWNFVYDIRYRNDSTNNKTIVWGSGREDSYTAGSGGSFTAPRGFFSTLTEYQPGKLLLTETDGTRFYFDNNLHKHITKMEEPNGNFINFVYSDTLLTSVVSKTGQTVTLSYTDGRLTTLTDAMQSPSRSYTYKYDEAGNLIEATDPLGHSHKYEYLVNGPMKSITDKNNNKVDIVYYSNLAIREVVGCNKRVSLSYDSVSLTSYATDHLDGGVNQVTRYEYKSYNGQIWLAGLSGNCCGFDTKFEFDASGNKIKETDAKGNTSSFMYDSRGNMLSATDPLNQTVFYTYSTDFNKITSFTDERGFVTTMSYDSKGNLVQLKEPGNQIYSATYNADGDIVTSTDPNGNLFTYSFDGNGNPSSVAGPHGYHATLGYDHRGNLISVTDSRGHTSTSEFDILNRLKKITDPLNNDVELSYDAEGNAVSLTNENNETTTLNYDASNRVVQVTDTRGKKAYASYDAMNNLSSITNVLGNSTKFHYDTRNRLSGITDAEGNTTSTSYDANGNVVGIRLPNGEQLTYSYDALNRLTTVSDQTGIVGTYSYDKNGNITRFQNGSGAAYTGEYDSLNRLKRVSDPLGNSYIMVYDKNGNVISVTDRSGQISTYTYDSLNRIKTSTNNNGFTVTTSYDAQGNISTLRDENNNITQYSFDELNRVKRTTYADGKYTENTYDKKSNVIARRLTDGTTIQYTYDSLDRMTSRTVPGGQVYSYGYDDLGRMISATNGAGTVLISYDAMNRIASETYNGRTVRYTYNVTGRTQSTVYPDSTVITKTYDTRNRLVSISKNNLVLASYQYNNRNQVITKNFANGVSTNLQYDFADRMTGISTGTGLIQNSAIAYNNNQHKTSVNRLNQPSASEQFSYDNGRRLTNYKRGPLGGPSVLQNTYSYDALGNRNSANLNGVNTSYGSNALNQMTNSNNGSLNISFTYDNNGNLTYDGKYFKTYDAEGRLLRDSSSPSNIITYQYDALNRRISKTMNGIVSYYTFSGITPIEERDGASGELISRTIFSNLLTPVVSEKNNRAYYYHQNESNSVEAITTQQGRLLERYEYDAYGKMTIFDSLGNTITGSLAGNRFGFTGQWYDSATAMYKFFFREYNPATGLFNERDLIGYADGMGMYQYVHNNPANGIDVYGLKDCPEDEKMKSIEQRAFDEHSHWLNTLTVIQQELKSRNIDLSKNEKFSKFNRYNNIANLITKIDLFRQKYDGMSSQDRQIEFAEIEVALIGLANDKVGNKLGPIGKAGSEFISMFGAVDAASQELTGKSLSRHYAEMDDGFVEAGAALARSVKGNQRRFDRHEEMLDKIRKISGEDQSQWTDEWREIAKIHQRAYDLGFRYSKRKKKDCPQNSTSGGSRKKPDALEEAIRISTEVIASLDPNEIIGPDGVGERSWVSINDRLPYTITYENDKSATAPAKFVKVIAPIHGKMDPASFQLGSFGFNNLTFTVPAGAASHYQRLDCRDSLGLFVDVVAGYDQLNNQAFWEFQSIDPTTLLTPADPLKGFLLTQDSSKSTSGHGFVNFTIKPIPSAHTQDSILARADIIFDTNDTIPTNVEKNTIDALPPVSALTDLPNTSISTEINLRYTGQDDVSGSGVKSYSIYVSDNNSVPELYVADFGGTDTSFIGVAGHTYKFYLSAKDSTGNTETLRLADSVQILSGETKICPGGSVSFDARVNGFHYQWQVNTGNGFVNISNGGIYSGANSAVLNLSNAPTSNYGNLYRCVVNGTRYSNVYLLKFEVSWEGTVSNQWENPVNWGCGVTPDANTDVIITSGKSNYPILNSNATIRALRINAGATATVNPGFTLSLNK